MSTSDYRSGRFRALFSPNGIIKGGGIRAKSELNGLITAQERNSACWLHKATYSFNCAHIQALHFRLHSLLYVLLSLSLEANSMPMLIVPPLTRNHRFRNCKYIPSLRPQGLGRSVLGLWVPLGSPPKQVFPYSIGGPPIIPIRTC